MSSKIYEGEMLHSTVQNVRWASDGDYDQYTEAVRAGKVIRNSVSWVDGQEYDLTRVVEYVSPKDQSTRWMYQIDGHNHAEMVDFPTLESAEVWYEKEVRSLADVEHLFDETDVEGVPTRPADEEDVALVWSVVRGDSPDTDAVEPGVAGVAIPEEVIAWAEKHGLDGDDPDVYLLVTNEDEASEVAGEIAHMTWDGSLADKVAILKSRVGL